MTPPLKAALWMIGAIFSFTAMAVAAREISQTHDSFTHFGERIEFSGCGQVLWNLQNETHVEVRNKEVGVCRTQNHYAHVVVDGKFTCKFCHLAIKR